MTRRLISSGSEWEDKIGYSRAVVDGEWVFVSGTTGFDYAAGTISDDTAKQARQAISNIQAALKEAGSDLSDVVRVHYILASAADWDAAWPVFGESFGKIKPAATAIIALMIDPKMKVEIEVTARMQKG
ncbi:MAG: RidA family protein [Rhodospirillales bacterium]|nr:RidA family protein [Rhodospirillales bacterium]MCW8861280.1 RidA family protein [Rhodospirillales bacterium]MCW8953291.1 RidA family protein [Rhodospirillales bacterium]MCW9001900.1 RidA family protein [Rhodospirillales bacterium]MCW9040656.1 RidA family protein [Rhodospirillales bacterium]